MDLDTLSIFMKLSDGITFSAAAEETNFSQAALSKRIIRLESELGVKLFDRSGRKVRLTPAGTVLRSELLSTLPALEKAIVRVKKHAGAPPLICGIIPLLTTWGLQDCLLEFTAAHPEVDFTFSIPRDKKCGLLDLCNGKLSFLITHAPIPERIYRVSPLHRDELLAVLPPAHPCAGQETVLLERLRGEHIFSSSAAQSTFDSIRSLPQFKCLLDTPVEILSRCEVVLTRVAMGQGIAFLHESALRTMDPGKVSVCRITGIPPSPLVLATLKRDPLTDAQQAFIDCIREKMAVYP